MEKVSAECFLKEYELKKAVSLTFIIFYWKEKEKLLQETLKLYTDFLDKASIRLKAGESNIWKKQLLPTRNLLLKQ
jgi:cobalt-zinc-cadmium resistance protein CzcA